MIEAANFMASELESKSRLKNLFYEWTEDIVYPYFVGEYNEEVSSSEDGLQESLFILTGFMRGPFLELEAEKEKMQNRFKNGVTAILESGSGIAVFYENAFSIDSGEADLKKMQINLRIKEWKVN